VSWSITELVGDAKHGTKSLEASHSDQQNEVEHALTAGLDLPGQTIERKIYFYHANAGSFDNGTQVPFDIVPALDHIDGLDFANDGRYVPDDDRVLCCWIDSTNEHPQLRLGGIRRNGLPQVERAGRLSDLNIPADSGLVEAIHIVSFEDNIFAADYNFYGPRMSQLSHYLAVRAAEQSPAVTFEALIHPDVEEQLNQLEDVRLFQLKIRAPFAAHVSRASANLGSAFEAAARVGNAEELEIILRPAKRSHNTLSRQLINAARSLLSLSDITTEASKFKIAGHRSDIGRTDTIDLLNEQLIAKADVVRQSRRGRAVDSKSVYEAIHRAYTELRPRLEQAAGIAQ
jgi:hypothetical protein